MIEFFVLIVLLTVKYNNFYGYVTYYISWLVKRPIHRFNNETVWQKSTSHFQYSNLSIRENISELFYQKGILVVNDYGDIYSIIL